jgi:hypothetical protein
MAQNGISTLLSGDGSDATANKEARQIAKLNQAQTRRQAGGDVNQEYYRTKNVYDRIYLSEGYNVSAGSQVWALEGRPWYDTAGIVNTPLNLVTGAATKLRIWYDGSDVTQFQPTNPSDGDTITQWNDKSNYAHNANPTGGATKRPTYQTNELNSLSVVQFDGTNDCLSINPIFDLRGIQKWSMFAVAKFTSLTGNRWISQTDTGDVGLYHNGTNMVVANASGTGTTTNTLDTTGYHYFSAVFDGTQSTNADRLTLRIDGSAETLNFGATTVGTQTSNSVDNLNVGCDGADSEYFQGFIAEYIVYYDALDGTEVGNLESYLTTRWAL